jgi:methionine-S-sulfoxide reductase
MFTRTAIFIVALTTSAGLLTGCSQSSTSEAPTMTEDTSYTETELLLEVQAQLAQESADTDAFVILSEALEAARPLPAGPQEELLTVALARAQEAREFRIREESPLPEGWPAPSLPGLIRVKTYPPTRAAWASQDQGNNRQFMTLFGHIQRRDIAMTAPVVMQHEQAMAGDHAESMAFLYRYVGQDEPGQFGSVEVVDEPVLTVVSVGMMGPYRVTRQRNALAELHDWLDAHPEWVAAGPPRVLAYNSPFVAGRHKYCEVQVPIRSATEEDASDSQLRRAIFAGGCFWGVEAHFEEVPGVLLATSGYTGGLTEAPSYQDVCTGQTGHAEAVEVVFDPTEVSYEQLARLFFEIHDPTQLNRQGPDAGTQYRSAVFYMDDEQRAMTESLIDELRENGYDVVTQVVPAETFYPAEDYHQDYLRNHPERYSCHVRVARFDTPASD